MSKFCSNCGEKLDDRAVICVKCGVPISNNHKQPGKGLSIASMVLGIIAIFYGTLLSFSSIILVISNEFYYYEQIIFSIIINFFPLILSITGLALGIASKSKIKNGMNTTGVILNCITIIICILSICLSIFF